MFKPFMKATWKSVHSNDKIQERDFVEDLRSGKRLPVATSSYKFLIGRKRSFTKHLPEIHDVVRFS